MRTSLLRVERTRRGLTQIDVADRAKIPRYKICLYEGGTLRLREDELERLEAIFGRRFSNDLEESRL
jgi:transcriptional regulator with XRE-family HTH domain